MPEGDTIHHAARRIRAVLVGPRARADRHAASAPQADRWPERLAGRTRARGRRARQAPVRALRRRADAALAPAHDRLVGRAPRRRALAARARRAWLVMRCGDWEVVQFDGPVLELMRESRTRLDRRLAALGPDVIGASFDEQAFLRRLRADDPARRDRRRAARPARRRRHRQRVEVGGVLRRGGQPVAPARPAERRGGARDRALRARAHARIGRRRRLQLAPARRLQARGHAVRALRHPGAQHGQGDDNRTTYWCPGCQL